MHIFPKPSVETLKCDEKIQPILMKKQLKNHVMQMWKVVFDLRVSSGNEKGLLAFPDGGLGGVRER